MRRLLLLSAMLGPLLTLWVLKPAVAAEDAQLSARPAKCISMRKGQVCYQTIRLRWHARDEGDYCLWAAQNSKPLKCWTRSPRGTHKYSFAANKNQVFYLTLADSDTRIATAQVSVAWVYRDRAPGRRAWRLF